jgi:5-methylcytosine-specific restriction endonuclease McrA
MLRELNIKIGKTCKGCGEWKTMNGFHKSRTTLDGRGGRDRDYQRSRREGSPQVRMRESLSARVSKVLREGGSSKGGSSVLDLLPYSLDDLICHLEKQFDGDMNWDNYGRLWSIDHIIPQSKFDFDGPNDKEFEKCWSLNNLRPLLVGENSSKGNSLSRKLVEEYDIENLLPKDTHKELI